MDQLVQKHRGLRGSDLPVGPIRDDRRGTLAFEDGARVVSLPLSPSILAKGSVEDKSEATHLISATCPPVRRSAWIFVVRPPLERSCHIPPVLLTDARFLKFSGIVTLFLH